MLKLTYFLILFYLVSCSSVEKRTELALEISKKNNFKNYIFNTQNYQIFSAQRLIHNKNIINIYIEGDGRSWIDRDTISSNPTPVIPVALNLASLDDKNNVIYLARPCQFVFNALCNDKVWTSQQFGNAVLKSYMEVLEAIKRENKDIQFNLIGYSGGATIVLMLAANRDDILSIRTLAGNLNHNHLSELTKTTPLFDSIRADSFILKTKNTPQIHYYGGKDKVISDKIYLNYKIGRAHV